MVGFPAKPAKPVEEELATDQDPKVKPFKDFPPIDSFLDFDSGFWVGSNRNIEDFSLEDTDFDFFEDDMEMGQDRVDETRPESQTTVKSESIEVKPEFCDDLCENIEVSSIKIESMTKVKPKLCDDMSANFDGGAEPVVKESDPVVSDNSRPMDGEAASVACHAMNLDESDLTKTDEALAASIEVGLENVSLTMDDDEKSDGAKGKTDSAQSESETSSSSSGSSDSSSSEEEESDEEESKKVGKEDDVAGELEEGEIASAEEKHDNEDEDTDDDDDDDDEVNEMIAWSNDEDEENGEKEPIRSKNELKELPPVPVVDVTLEPHHATLPVGVVLSVISTQVIVEGMEKHSPLTEGSILWITERRTPLGLVDEIFGPVKCPYYIVRFNSENEVPDGISQGTHVSFVADFAQHILNIKELQKKGYDASGDNDEEIPDELEFSDDEKEAEYRRMLKIEKRGMMTDQKTGNTRNKKKKNRVIGRHTMGNSGEWTENQGSSSLSSNRSDQQMSGPVSNLPPRPQMDGFPPNNAGWRPQSNQQNQYQLPPPIPNQMGIPNLSQLQIPLMAMQNQMTFQPQFNGGQMSIPGGAGGLNLFQGEASAPWPALLGQMFGMGRGIQQQPLPNEMSFNMFASQGFQMQQPQSHMHRPQSAMNPQFQMPPQFQSHLQSPMNPQFQMRPQFQTHLQAPMNQQYQMMNPPQASINPQFQMQPQSDIRPESQIHHSPTNSQSQMQQQAQGFNTGQSSERGRGHRGPGRGRGRGRFGRGRGGRGRGLQQSG